MLVYSGPKNCEGGQFSPVTYMQESSSAQEGMGSPPIYQLPAKKRIGSSVDPSYLPPYVEVSDTLRCLKGD